MNAGEQRTAGGRTIEIDGSTGEGGGQVLRSALALSCLTRQRVRIRNIRAGRRNPGLAPQHLTATRAMAAICAGQVEGDRLGSTEVSLDPGGGARPGDYSFDIAAAAKGGSAGSVTLLAQSLILPLVLAGGRSRLTLKGGTHVRWSPPFEYLNSVFLPRLAEMGIRSRCRLKAWGFYPAGGGEIELEVEGISADTSLHAQRWTERGQLVRVGGTALAGNLPAHIPQRMTDRSRSLLHDLGATFAVHPRRVTGASPGAGLFLVAEYESTSAGFAAHGRPGRPSERVAEEAVQALLGFHRSGAALDEHMGDQILLPLALAPGASEFTTTKRSGHLTTNASIIGRFLGSKPRISEAGVGLTRVEVDGMDPRTR